MNALFCIFIFLLGKLQYSNSFEVYSLEEIFKIINELNEPEENLQFIIKNLSETLNKIYAYNEVAKNPPQPEFDKNYYSKINIQEQLKNINTKTTNAYQFYREIKLILNSLGDYHLKFGASNSLMNILVNIHFLEPVSFRIEEYRNEYRIFADIGIREDLYKEFKNYQTIFDIIAKNTETPILSINGKNPFEYFTNFGGDFRKLKSEQANFRSKFLSRNGQTFSEFPLTIEELCNFTIIYDNGDTILTDYMVYSDISLNETEFIKKKIFLI